MSARKLQQLSLFLSGAENVDNNFSPIDALYSGALINPDAIAAQDNKQTITYSELMSCVEALATGLKAQTLANRRVGLCAQNSIDHLVAWLAILAAGLIWVPINPKNGQSLNKRLTEKCDLELILLDSSGQDLELHEQCQRLDLDSDCRELVEKHRGQNFTPRRPTASEVMAIKFTGGSTGEPKGVMQTYGNVTAVIKCFQSLYEFDQNDCNLAVAPLTHGAAHYILPILAAGGRHILLNSPDIPCIQKAFKHQGVTTCFMPPTLIYKLLDAPTTHTETFPSLRHFTYSAAPMPCHRIQQAIETLGPKLSTVYGQTEAPMVISVLSPDDMANPKLQSSVGKATVGNEVVIFDSERKPLPAGETGEIAVRGEIVMKDYLNLPERETPWLLTGDLGYLDAQGYLFIQGRLHDVIISGGFNIYPAEVENALAAIDGIRECIVFSSPDDYWGECLEAAVCLTPGSTLKEARIQSLVKEQLGPVKTPKHVHILPSLPRNPVGKVVRKDVQHFIHRLKEQENEVS